MKKPERLLLSTAIALSIARIFLPSTHIAFEDATMFGIPLQLFAWMIPVFLIFSWLIYRLTKRFLYSTALTWTHVVITVTTTILIVIILYVVINSLQAPSTFLLNSHELISTATRIVFIMFLGGQCAYVANLLLGIVKRGSRLSKHAMP